MNRGQNELRKGASGGGLRACKGPEVDCVRASLRRIEGPRWLELSEPRAETGLGMAVLTRRHILYGVDTMSPPPPPFTTDLPCLLLRLCPLPPCPLCLEWGVQVPRGRVFLRSHWNLGEVGKPEFVLDSFPGLSSGLEAHEEAASPRMPVGPGTAKEAGPCPEGAGAMGGCGAGEGPAGS